MTAVCGACGRVAKHRSAFCEGCGSPVTHRPALLRPSGWTYAQRIAVVAATVILLFAVWHLFASFQVRTGRYVYQQVTCGPSILRVLKPKYVDNNGTIGVCWDRSVGTVQTSGALGALTVLGLGVSMALLREPASDSKRN